MKIIQDLMIILEPEEGYLLTDGITYTDKVYLGCNSSPSEWKDIKIEEVPPNELVIEDNLSNQTTI